MTRECCAGAGTPAAAVTRSLMEQAQDTAKSNDGPYLSERRRHLARYVAQRYALRLSLSLVIAELHFGSG
jgi:hypothetical protein